MTASMRVPAPSPNGTNREGLFLRTVLVNRDQILALDIAHDNKAVET